MPDLAFDLRFLKYAMLAAEHGSFRRVAQILDLPQSTVSRRVQLLERRIGSRLFERTTFGVRLTPAGERFLRDATFGADHIREAVKSISLARRGVSGELRIGLMASLARGFLADLLSKFNKRFPSIELRLEEGTAQACSAGVLTGRLDAAFIPGVARLSGCRAEALWAEKIYAVMQDTHAAAKTPLTDWESLRGENFLVSYDGPGPEIEDYLIRHLSVPGFRPKISIQRVGRETLLNLVARGFGVTLTTDSTLGAVYPGLSFQPIEIGENLITSSIIWQGSNQNPALELMLALSLALRCPTMVAGDEKKSTLATSCMSDTCKAVIGSP